MAPGEDSGALAAHLEKRNYSALIKQLDGVLGEAQGGARLQLLLNRGFCLQQLGLFRKALKVWLGAGTCGECVQGHSPFRLSESASKAIDRAQITPSCATAGLPPALPLVLCHRPQGECCQSTGPSMSGRPPHPAAMLVCCNAGL